MGEKKGAIIYDFDNTLTTTDTIKFAVMSLLVNRLQSLHSVVRCYVAMKAGTHSPEVVKHSIIGTLIAGRDDRWIDNCMKLYVAMVGKFLHRTVWKKMLHYKSEKECVIVATASPHFAVDAFLRAYEIPVIGTRYECRAGVYTGRPLLPIPFNMNKLQKVNEYLAEYSIDGIELAYSDSLADIPLLQASRHGYLIGKNGTEHDIRNYA